MLLTQKLGLTLSICGVSRVLGVTAVYRYTPPERATLDTPAAAEEFLLTAVTYAGFNWVRFLSDDQRAAIEEELCHSERS